MSGRHVLRSIMLRCRSNQGVGTLSIKHANNNHSSHRIDIFHSQCILFQFSGCDLQLRLHIRHSYFTQRIPQHVSRLDPREL